MADSRGLGDAYGAMLYRIKEQSRSKSRLALATLMWISKSQGPMNGDELCQDLGVLIGSTDPNPDLIPSMEALLASCFGLVTVDEGEPTVHLMHITPEEYLDSCPEVFQNSSTVMTEICVTYLKFNCIRKLPFPLDHRQKYTFLWHASYHWSHYARNQTTEGVKWHALRLLDEFDSHISAKLPLDQCDFETW